jgi:hypothetical protein
MVWLDTMQHRCILEHIERTSGIKTEVLGHWATYPWIDPRLREVTAMPFPDRLSTRGFQVCALSAYGGNYMV